MAAEWDRRARGEPETLQDRAQALRTAYVGGDRAARLAAIKSLWGEGGADPYGRWVLTAAAAAMRLARTLETTALS